MIGEHVVITSPTFYGAFGVVIGQWPTGPGRSWAATRYEVSMPGYGSVTIYMHEFMTLTKKQENEFQFVTPKLCLERMHILQYEAQAVKDFSIGWHDRAISDLRVADEMRARIGEQLEQTIYEWEVT